MINKINKERRRSMNANREKKESLKNAQHGKIENVAGSV
jgi:hypothetical protein